MRGSAVKFPVKLSIFICISVMCGAAALTAQSERTIWSGPYTADQAARGKRGFAINCGRCHNSELEGTANGPALKGPAFIAKHENDSLGAIFIFMRDNMPRDAAGPVDDATKVDILAYILQRNEIPAGTTELTLDIPALEGIRVTKRGVWDGIYTAAQAERGKQNFLNGRCGGCHKLDLSGDRGPALKGDAFVAHWENDTVGTLFKKISETMPPTAPNEVADDLKIDIVAFLLQSNGFPAGDRELTRDEKALEAFEVRRKDATGTPNFALVQVVGCLAREPGRRRWTLLSATNPVVTREDHPSAAALNNAASEALGRERVELISAAGFKPETHVGEKVEARGLLYQDRHGTRLNLTSLEPIDRNCSN
jgi:mono/diheme cytochrome c family protein